MKFEYKRSDDITLEAYGRVFTIPPKTAPLVDGVNRVNAAIAAATATASDQVKALRDGVALFIGEDETESIYPAADIDAINIDEISAFWFVLNEMSNRETNAVIAKYAPKPKNEIKVTSNPKK